MNLVGRSTAGTVVLWSPRALRPAHRQEERTKHEPTILGLLQSCGAQYGSKSSMQLISMGQQH